MKWLKSLCSAFLMYSRIPMPTVAWTAENRRYALCFFPLIGAVIGAALLLWAWLGQWLAVHEVLFAVVAVLIPIGITGGIHLDGFCDVCDAKACCGTREKMLSVMSDSHIGAFAVIHLCLYLLLQMGLYTQVFGENMAVTAVVAMGFVQSRAWSGLAAVTFRNAKGEGTLHQFSQPADKAITITIEILFLLLTTVGMAFIGGMSGIFGAVGGGLTFVYYRVFAYRKFGGITGDLAGYFLQLCELATLACVALSLLIGSR